MAHQYAGFENESEFLAYHPSSLMEDFADATKDFCCDIADSIEKKMKQEKHMTAKSPEQVNQEVEQMLEVLNKTFALNFESFNTYALQHFFTLPEDINFESPSSLPPSLHIPTQEEEEEIEKEIEVLRVKYVKINDEVNKAKETKESLKHNVAIITNLRDKLQGLLLLKENINNNSTNNNNNNNILNTLDKEIHNISVAINNVKQKMVTVEALHKN